MKKIKISLCVLTISASLIGMDKPLATSGGPMNAEWFYHQSNPFKRVIKLHEKCRWDNAELGYEVDVEKPTITEYDKHKGLLNWASCAFALGKSSEYWQSFDDLIHIPSDKRISKELITSSQDLKDQLVHVRTDQIGIGDILHFMKAAALLKESTECHIVFSVRDFLKDVLSGFAIAYNINVMDEKEKIPVIDYETHLISLLGYLELKPQDVIPQRVLLTTSERALVEVSQQITPLLALGKTIVAVFLGENRTATLIGGKRLANRHLDSAPFKELLRNQPHAMLMDAGTEDSRVIIDEDQKKQYLQLAPEKSAFDTIIALALYMNIHKNIITIGADNGPTNLFARALDSQAQQRMAFVIPHGGDYEREYDMRMEGTGKRYKHMLYENCMVYKCENRSAQADIIRLAYDDIIERDMKPDTFSFDLKPGMLVKR